MYPPHSPNPAKNQPHVAEGMYDAHVTRSYHTQSQRGTPGYRVVFQITSTYCKGHQLSHTVWLTQKAELHARRWLDVFNVDSPRQLRDGDLTGQSVRICVYHETSAVDNRRYARVQVIEKHRPRPALSTP